METLQNVFPLFGNFSYSNKGNGQYIIKHGIIDSKYAMFATLHEVGHIAQNHEEKFGLVSLMDVNKEIEAWKYALKCIKARHESEMIRFALLAIQSYNSEAEINYGEYYSTSEIINLLKKEVEV